MPEICCGIQSAPCVSDVYFSKGGEAEKRSGPASQNSTRPFPEIRDALRQLVLLIEEAG
jgi:hypothetical protein